MFINLGYLMLFFLCLIGVVSYYLLVEKPPKKKSEKNRADVSSYVENDVVYWRWVCLYDKFGLYDFKSKKDALRNLKMLGYWTE